MGNYCYILYSLSIDRYYIGETENIEERLEQHLSGFCEVAFTKQTKDWQLYYSIECKNRSQARLIEAHLKRMKSRKYLENLKEYPEISERLLIKYSI